MSVREGGHNTLGMTDVKRRLEYPEAAVGQESLPAASALACRSKAGRNLSDAEIRVAELEGKVSYLSAEVECANERWASAARECKSLNARF